MVEPQKSGRANSLPCLVHSPESQTSTTQSSTIEPPATTIFFRIQFWYHFLPEVVSHFATPAANLLLLPLLPLLVLLPLLFSLPLLPLLFLDISELLPIIIKRLLYKGTKILK